MDFLACPITLGRPCRSTSKVATLPSNCGFWNFLVIGRNQPGHAIILGCSYDAWQDCGQLARKLKDFGRAADFFLKAGNYKPAVECRLDAKDCGQREF